MKNKCKECLSEVVRLILCISVSVDLVLLAHETVFHGQTGVLVAQDREEERERTRERGRRREGRKRKEGTKGWKDEWIQGKWKERGKKDREREKRNKAWPMVTAPWPLTLPDPGFSFLPLPRSKASIDFYDFDRTREWKFWSVMVLSSPCHLHTLPPMGVCGLIHNWQPSSSY